MNFFNNNLGIHALVIYFCFMLIELINDYKNICSHNNNVFWGICMMVFMKIDSFKKLLLLWWWVFSNL